MNSNGRHTFTIDQLKAPAPGAIAIGPFGSRMKSDTYTTSGIPVIRGTNLGTTKTFQGEFVFISTADADSFGNCNVYEGDLVFPHRGSIGEVGLVTGKDSRYIISSSLMKLTVDRKLADPAFLFYWFKSAEGRHALLANASQVGTPGIATPLASLRSIKLALPSPQKQSNIAHILGTLDDKIELNRRMNATLEAMARALFQSWFVDFDPVRAKAAGQTPAGMDKATADLFPSEFEDSELGEVPKGWKIKTIGDLCQINTRTLSKKDDLEELEYVEISAVSRGDISSMPRYMREDAPSRARRCLQHGDIALSTVRPDRGAYFLALNPPEDRIASTGFAVLSPHIPYSFLYVQMTNDKMSEKLGKLADGGAYPAVQPDQIAAIGAVVPADDGILDHFHHLTEPLLERMEQNRQESRTLAALRDLLLPELLSGRTTADVARTLEGNTQCQ